MQTYGRLPGRVRARRGHAPLGQRGQGVPRLPHRARGRRRSATRTRRSPTRSPTRPARCCTSRTCTSTTCSRGSRSGSTCCSPRRPARRAGCSSPTRGAEANECAIKLARRHGQANGGPERFHVLSAYNSFHGRTLTTLAATGQPQKQETFQPLPDRLPPGRVRRRRRAAPPRWTSGSARSCSSRSRARAGCSPRRPATSRRCGALCDEREALLLIDEVQTGLGRTGRWFGFEHGGDVRPGRRDDGEGARQRRADRRVLGPRPTSRRRSGPATTPRRSAASRSRRVPRSRCST